MNAELNQEALRALMEREARQAVDDALSDKAQGIILKKLLFRWVGILLAIMSGGLATATVYVANKAVAAHEADGARKAGLKF